jgi:hypothetical protein
MTIDRLRRKGASYRLTLAEFSAQPPAGSTLGDMFFNLNYFQDTYKPWFFLS